VPGINRDLVQFRHHAVNAEGLVAQLTSLNDLIAEAHIRLHRLRFRALEGQVLAGHITVLAVRSRDFIPAGRGLVEHDHLAAFLIFSENLVIRARTGAQMQRPTLGRDPIDLHVVGVGLVLLRHQIDAGCHSGGHRRSQNAALRKPRPFASFVDVMHQRKLPFTVQRLGHGAGHGRNRTEAIARKIVAVGRIYTDQGKSPPSGRAKAPSPKADAKNVKLECIYMLYYLLSSLGRLFRPILNSSNKSQIISASWYSSLNALII